MNCRKLFYCIISVCLGLSGCEKDENIPREVSTISRLYVSSSDLDAAVMNTSIFDRADRDTLPDPYRFDSKLPDANGIFFDVSTGTVFQVSRRAKNIKTFTVNTDGTLKDRTSFIDESVPSARDIAFDRSNNLLYLSSNTDSAIYVYDKAGALTGTVTAGKKLKLNGQPWAIHLEANQLFVVMDRERTEIQIFENASSLVVGTITPTTTLKISGAVRLHGIAYSAERDAIILTDIGQESGQGSLADGAIHIISGAAAKVSAGGTITPDRTVRGSATLLGNPVDLAWDDREESDLIYIAEKSGNRILVFKFSDSANAAPSSIKKLASSPESLYLDAR